MSDQPTPLRAHRSYNKATKVKAVIAAEMVGTKAAAKQHGIPERTVAYWFDHPDFANIRAKTRDDLAEETMGMAHLVLGEIKRRIGEFGSHDLAILYGILTDKGQLLTGHATSRTETRDITDTLGDAEREALRKAIDDYLASAPVEEPV